MDKFLKQLALKVSDEIDYAKNLLDIIRLIPTHRNIDLLLRLEKALGSNPSEGDAKISSQLTNLWSLEEAKSKNEKQDKVESSISTKSRASNRRNETLLHATVALAASIRESSETVRDILLDWKNDNEGKSCQTSSKEIDTTVTKLKDYLERIKDNGYEDLCTSVKKEHQLTTELFKLSEKCKMLDEEKKKINSHLNEKELLVEEEVVNLNNRRNTLTKDLENAKSKADSDIHELEEEVTNFLAVEQKKHDETMGRLESELTNAKLKLDNLRENNAKELQDITEEKERLSNSLSNLLNEHKVEEKRIEDEIQVLRNKTKAEVNDRVELEKLLNLHELNISISDKEEAIIQSVIDLEHKADAILDHAAAQVQKLYRGMRDRTEVKKLKKKLKKGKKQKGKKSKTKKS